jgi:hypothetical protein
MRSVKEESLPAKRTYESREIFILLVREVDILEQTSLTVIY